LDPKPGFKDSLQGNGTSNALQIVNDILFLEQAYTLDKQTERQ